MDKGASPAGTGLSPTVEPASGLDGFATSIPSTDLIRFSHRDKVTRACMDPGAFVGPRFKTADGWYEHMDHWRARAAIEAMMQLAVESRSFAQAIEARRAETRSGSVADESAVPEGDASQ